MPRESIRALKCYAGGQPYCIEMERVLAIERGEGLIPSREASGPCAWMSRRGSRIPVFGLAELLNVGPRSGDAPVVLIVDRANPWGIAVDRVARLEGSSAIQPMPAAANGPQTAHFRGVILDAGSLVLVLAPERLRSGAAQSAGETIPAAAAPASSPSQPPRAASAARLLLFILPNSDGPADGEPDEPSGRFLLGLSYSQTLEIVSGLQSTPVPSAPPHVLGLVCWRSRPVAVVDAGALLGFAPTAAKPDGRLVVVRSPRWQAPIALPVGTGLHARSLPLAHGPCPPDLPLNLTFTRGAFALGKHSVLLLPNLDSLAAPPTGQAALAGRNL